MTVHNGHIPTPLETAKHLEQLRLMPIQVPFGQKDPHRRGWQAETYDRSKVDAIFNRQTNIGVRLGQPAEWCIPFVDVDLDTIQAIVAARFYLPATRMMWGRASKPRSHYGYQLTSLDGVK